MEAVTLPEYLDDILGHMGAKYAAERSHIQPLLMADNARLRNYLGTYFPRTVIESRTVLTELLSIPPIADSLADREVIRILDVGSGTGGAVVGMLLALMAWGRCKNPVEIISFDANETALHIQSEVLAALKGHLAIEFLPSQRVKQFPNDCRGFSDELARALKEEDVEFDLVSYWKCLCEFYWDGNQGRSGIIRSAIQLALEKLTTSGVCVVADITCHAGKAPYFFPEALNRESNCYDRDTSAIGRTILPIPCAHNSEKCFQTGCFTQREFRVSHRLCKHDRPANIAYRVFAKNPFAEEVTRALPPGGPYRIKSNDRKAVCDQGKLIADRPGDAPCGFTAFVPKECESCPQ